MFAVGHMAMVGPSSSHRSSLLTRRDIHRLADSVHQVLLVKGGMATCPVTSSRRVADIMRYPRAVYGELITNYNQVFEGNVYVFFDLLFDLLGN